jgi:polar amino acid transport system substrate-binding protein
MNNWGFIGRNLLSAFLVAATATLANAQSTPSALERIEQTKTLRVGMAEFAPFVVKDTKTGQLQGFEVDVANQLVADLGVKLELVEAAWPTIIAGLQADKYDVVMSGMKRTLQRAESVSFSEPYVSLIEKAMVREDSGINSWADIDKAGNRVASVLGGASYLKIDAAKGSYLKAAELTPYKDLTLCGSAVIGKQATAWVEDGINIATFEAAHPEVKFKTVAVPFAAHGEGNGYAVRHGQDDLLNVLNIFITRMKNDGSYDQLAQKWGLPRDILVPGIMQLQEKG